MIGIDGLRGKILAVLLAFALVPMALMGILSLGEMNRASSDIESNITGLATSLNRSALAAGSNDADQVQLAEAKARQIDAFFLRIASENELVAKYAASISETESCETPAGIWIAPSGSDKMASERRDAAVRSLCVPARLMQEIHKADSSISLSYIGTEEGVLAVWPYSNKTLSNAAPFSYKDKSYYEKAKEKKQTIWTGPYSDTKGKEVITVTTPFFRQGEFAGIAGMDISLYPIYSDLSSLKGRGFPFLIDSTGLILYRPKIKPESYINSLFATDNLIESADPEVRYLGREMLEKSTGSILVGLEQGDGYVAFSRINVLGWTLGIAYAAEEMSLPARYIDSGIKDVANGTISSLDDASGRIGVYAFMVFLLAALSVLAAGYWLAGRVEAELASIIQAADRVSRGDLEIEVNAGQELAGLGASFNRMVQALRAQSNKKGQDASIRGPSCVGTAFLEGMKRSLVPPPMPSRDDYEIRVMYWPSPADNFDLYHLEEVEGRIVLAMADVAGDGEQAAMLAIMSRTLIIASHEKLNPEKAIADLNSQIIQHGHGTNLAAFYAILDPLSHTLEYVNAGFNPPFIVDPGGMVDTLGGGGLALGMLEPIELRKTLIPLQPEDVMVMYSDGVIEAENSLEKQFGVERLINLVIANRDRPASEILLAAEKDLMEHTKTGRAESDAALIILKRLI
ncbi:MAG TPA: SpoIIE family protein phosphatase [Methanothrix sp.]|nr:SpoIIE family protein phosphatase [Methanothrix sp.]